MWLFNDLLIARASTNPYRGDRAMSIRILLLATMLIPSAVSGLEAQRELQAGHGPARVPVTIVLSDHVPHTDGPFVLQRRPGRAPVDVIVLRSSATADELSAAVSALLSVRQVHGDLPTTAGTLRVRPNTARRHTSFPWTPRVLADLHNAQVKEFAGFGRVRSVQIWLPGTHRPRPVS